MTNHVMQLVSKTNKEIIITDDEGRKERRKEHFEEILNRDKPTNPVAISEENYPEIETININPLPKMRSTAQLESYKMERQVVLI